MKKVLFSAIACLVLAGTTYASTGDVETKIVKDAKKTIVGNCIGKFTVTDAKGTVVFSKTLDFNEATGDDCLKVMGAAHSLYEQSWGAGYKVSSVVTFG